VTDTADDGDQSSDHGELGNDHLARVDPSSDNSANWWYCVQVDGAGCYRVNPPQTTFTHPKLAPDRTTTWTSSRSTLPATARGAATV
jgi:hypothetical protein